MYGLYNIKKTKHFDSQRFRIYKKWLRGKYQYKESDGDLDDIVKNEQSVDIKGSDDYGKSYPEQQRGSGRPKNVPKGD